MPKDINDKLSSEFTTYNCPDCRFGGLGEPPSKCPYCGKRLK